MLRDFEKYNEDTVLMKIRKQQECKHEKIVDDKCMICFDTIHHSTEKDYNSYLFQMGPNKRSTKLKGVELEIEENRFINRLYANKKLILMLDLDNTILHSITMQEINASNL